MQSQYKARLAADEPSNGVSPDDLLTVAEVSEMTGIGRKSLYTYSSRRKNGRKLGPEPVRVGNALLYRRADVEAWHFDRVLVFGGER